MRKYISFIILASILILLFAFGFPPIGNWYQQGFPYLNGKTITDITFLDSLTGYAVTNYTSSTDSGYILKTTNGGDNWNFSFSVVNNGFTKIQFVNSNTGFACGGHGLPYLCKTTNAGQNWFSVSSFGCSKWEGMNVLNEDTLWVVDPNGLCGGVYRTTNGGVNWTQQLNLMSQNPTKIYMFNARIGFITNGSNFKKTTNSGVNWFDVDGGPFWDIQFIDSLTGWKVRGNILKTTNGGLNWETQMLPQVPGSFGHEITKLNIFNKDTIWAAGASISYPLSYRGVIHKTTNGGTNWGYQIPDTSIHIFNYSFIKFTDRLKGWAYSSVSTMGGVHTKTGGLDTTIFTAINQPGTGIVSDFRLYQNYPNPFNPVTVINYELRNTSYLVLKVFDLNGKEVTTLINQKQNSGSYSINFDANKYNLSSGIYFYTLQTDNFKEAKKMILIK
jgi:photosystem II stability/assembly factor-like uncharacterized protein